MAWGIMEEADQLLTEIDAGQALLFPNPWIEAQERANALVYAYFQLDADEIAIIEELASLVGTALQPTSLRHKSLMKPLRQAPSQLMVQGYASVLSRTLCKWRNATGGEGEIHVATWTGRSVPLGATVLTLGQEKPADRFADDSIIEIVGTALKRVTEQSAESLLTIPDMAIIDGNRIFLVKPLVARFWMRHRAVEDANHLALQLQSLSGERIGP
jgi:hypothetical protein